MIELQSITKSYGERKAVNGISLEIREGEFYGLLGPNGAGKTTTISMMSGILNYDSGEITMAVVSVNYWSIQSFYDVFWRNISIAGPTFLTRIGGLFLLV